MAFPGLLLTSVSSECVQLGPELHMFFQLPPAFSEVIFDLACFGGECRRQRVLVPMSLSHTC